jgi:hypothetical protein
MEETKNIKNEFVKALIRAQQNFKPVKKDKSNSFLKSHYATYASIWEAVGEVLNAEGFAIFHSLNTVNETLVLRTTLVHIGGHEESSYHPVNFGKEGTMQDLGKGETYAKRYNLIALTAVPVSDETDDDGESDRKRKANVSKYEAKASTITFGKYKGKLLSDIPQDYAYWLIDNSMDVELVEELKKTWLVAHE